MTTVAHIMDGSFLLPFLFTLAVVYGLLSMMGDEKEGLFGKNSVNMIIALVFAVFAAGYEPFVVFFFSYFGIILWAFVGLFFLAFFKKVLSTGKKDKKEKAIYAGVILLVFASIAGLGTIYAPEFEIPVLGTQNFVVVLGLFLVLYVIYNTLTIDE